MNNNQHNFCSDECRRKWYAEIWSQSDEWKEISKQRAVKILENNQINTNTKPQQIINKILNEMKIEFLNEYNCKYYSIDNYLIKNNLMIEVMGDFWHGNPNRYNYENLTEIQKKRIPKDKAKHTYIKNIFGIEILYLWESEINTELDLCKKLIKEYIDNNGFLKNYHSFNYHLENSSLKLNNKIIVPFQDKRN